MVQHLDVMDFKLIFAAFRAFPESDAVQVNVAEAALLVMIPGDRLAHGRGAVRALHYFLQVVMQRTFFGLANAITTIIFVV